MGDYNVTCGISNLTINNGDRIGLNILIPTRLSRGYLDSRIQGSMYYMGIYDHFTPFAAPVYGTYDSYGGLENIERNETVDFLEAFFGKDIATIVDCVGGSFRGLDDSYNPIHVAYFSEERKTATGNGYAAEDLENVQLLQSFSGMFFLREVYDVMSVKTEGFDTNYMRNVFKKFKEFEEKLPAGTDEKEKDELFEIFHGSDVERYWGIPLRGLEQFRTLVSFEELATVDKLAAVLCSVNRMFQPTPSGEQYGNEKAMLNLLKVSKKITKQRIKIYEEYEEEDED